MANRKIIKSRGTNPATIERWKRERDSQSFDQQFRLLSSILKDAETRFLKLDPKSRNGFITKALELTEYGLGKKVPND